MMAESTLLPLAAQSLPEELKRAQEAMFLPEVQEMLKALSKHNLGIYMPHTHDEKTGSFQPLPSGITQVEDGLKVSFVPEQDCVAENGRSFVPVGWVYDPNAITTYGAAVVAMTCTSRCIYLGTMHTSGHDKSVE
jgi:hypothetical protein